MNIRLILVFDLVNIDFFRLLFFLVSLKLGIWTCYVFILYMGFDSSRYCEFKLPTLNRLLERIHASIPYALILFSDLLKLGSRF